MAKEFDEKLYDRRVVEKNIRNGVISQKDHEKFLKSLDDDSDNAEDVVVTMASSGQTPKGSESDEEV